jgi:hypothetical protein
MLEIMLEKECSCNFFEMLFKKLYVLLFENCSKKRLQALGYKTKIVTYQPHVGLEWKWT